MLLVALLVALVLCPSLRAGAQDHQPEVEIETAPVEVDGQVLFRVRGASSMPADARAARVSNRIEATAADRTIRPEELFIRDVDGIAWIMARDQRLVGVIDADARLEQLTRADLAVAHMARIRAAINEYREARQPEAIRRDLRDAVGATAVFVAVVVVLMLLARWLRRRLSRWVQGRVDSTVMSSLDLVRGERIASVIQQVFRLLASLVLIVILFEYLSFTLFRFPATRRLSTSLFALFVGPLQTMGNGLLAQIPNLAFLAVLFVVMRLILRLLRVIFDAIGRGALRFPGFEADWALPTYKIVRFVLVAFGIVVAYPYLPGSQSDAFKGVSLFVGVLFSLGSTSAISNLIAGYVLIYRRVFKVGDMVKIGDVIGEVTEFRIQVTRLKSLKNEEVVFPNSQILGTQITNYSVLARGEGLILHTEVGIGYETPWRQVEAMLLAAAEHTPGILRAPAPFVLQRALANCAVTYELNVYCANAQRMLEVYADMHRQILDVFNQYNVQIMTPLYIADPPEPKVVPPAQWYTAPAAPPQGTKAPG